MRALSLSPPWTVVVVTGLKPIENRRWKPSPKMLGKYFAIHAALKPDPEAYDRIAAICGYHVDPKEDVYGAIIGVARLVGWVSKEMDSAGLTDEQRAFVATSPWFFGPYGFLLDEVQAIAKPVPCRGALSFWEMPPDVEAQVVAQLAKPLPPEPVPPPAAPAPQLDLALGGKP